MLFNKKLIDIQENYKNQQMFSKKF